MALGARVEELRLKLGWKQVTLAKNSGIPQATISRIESGKVTQPRLDQLKKLADALGITIDYLVGDSSIRVLRASHTAMLEALVQILEEVMYPIDNLIPGVEAVIANAEKLEAEAQR